MKNNKYGFIYKTTCLINKKIYIGQRMIREGWGKNSNQNYLGSGTEFLKDLEHYGRKNFKRKILEYCNSAKNLNKREVYWIAYFDSRNSIIGYNKTIGGVHPPMSNRHHTPESKLAMRLKKLGKPAWNKGVKRSSESIVKQKVSRKKNKNIKPPWNKGKKMSKEFSLKLSKSLKGKYPSPFKGVKGRYNSTTIEKIRKASIGNTNMLGKKHSAEAKLKMSISHKANPSDQGYKTVQIDPDTNSFIKIFKSRKEAVKETNILINYRALVLQKGLSGGFKWRYIKDLTKTEIKNQKIKG